jgi:hypothetical protein
MPELLLFIKNLGFSDPFRYAVFLLSLYHERDWIKLDRTPF